MLFPFWTSYLETHPGPRTSNSLSKRRRFAVIMKQFRALAFVPAIDVIACYEELINSLSDELVDDLSDFPHYFEKTWIGL